jgi:hypothetical protein
MILNNRIRGLANFALSVVSMNGTPKNTIFLMNHIENFSPAQAGLFVDVGGSNTVLVGQPTAVEDHGDGTVVVPWAANTGGSRVN